MDGPGLIDFNYVMHLVTYTQSPLSVPYPIKFSLTNNEFRVSIVEHLRQIIELLKL